MTTNRFYNILCNMNDLESIFVQRCQDTEVFDLTGTYEKFLDNYFVTSNKLSDLYYPLQAGRGNGGYPVSVSSINQLSEIQQIYEDLDVNITKAFNFPVCSMHTGACYECVYVMEGRAEFQLEERSFVLNPGDFFFHAPGDKYALRADTDSIVINLDMRRSYICEAYPRLFSGCPEALNFFDTSFSNRISGNYLIFHTENQKELQDTVFRLFIEYLWGDEYRGAIIRGNFEILMTYLKRYAAGTPETLYTASVTERNYNLILNYLFRNYRDATLGSTAEAVHFSRQYISRIIRQAADTSFSRLLKSIRVEKACQYLEETSLSLESIAELTGFSSTSYLWRTFKELKGTAPSEYRNSRGQAVT